MSAIADDAPSGAMTASGPILSFDRGTLLLAGFGLEAVQRIFGADYWRHDPRVGTLRRDAASYHEVRALLKRELGRGFEDRVLRDPPARWREVSLPDLRPDQAAALSAWRGAGGRGVVVMPTGAGKTEVALAAMAKMEKATLVVAPIRDLMYQWHRRILGGLGVDAGVVGDNLYAIKPVTVTTYDSAAIHGPTLGDRYQLVVFDEVHHLPGKFYREAALTCAAPFRMGLTATLERPDGKHAELEGLVGKVVYHQAVAAARGKTIADYEVVRVPVALAAEEQARYDALSRQVREFMLARRRDDPLYTWERALADAARDPEARQAKLAFWAKQKIENEALEKLRVLEDIFRLHASQRVLVFAGSNPMAVKISRRFLIPVILAAIGKKERLEVLKGFADGRFPALVANRVLDEGVDVPAAKVAVVVGGLGSARQAKQRLGRILRRSGAEKGVLYEVVCETHSEQQRSRARRRSDAFK